MFALLLCFCAVYAFYVGHWGWGWFALIWSFLIQCFSDTSTSPKPAEEQKSEPAKPLQPVVCSQCDHLTSPNAKFCPRCGQTIGAKTC